MTLHIMTKYFLHTIDLQSENPWENKAVYLLYAEVVLGKILHSWLKLLANMGAYQFFFN